MAPPETALRIAVENSTWNNIGDAFYQMAIIAVLRKFLPLAQINSLDGPSTRAFRTGRFRENAFDFRFHSNADHYVFSGPILGADFLRDYAPLIKHIIKKGRSYSLLSVHAYAEGDLLAQICQFLKSYPPLAIHTRDTYTWKKLQSLNVEVYDGICFAFFVNEIDGIEIKSSSEPYVCLSYHSQREPKLAIRSERSSRFSEIAVLGRGSALWNVQRHFEWMQRHQTRVGAFQIVRPVHGFYPSPHLTHSKPNSYITYNPKIFLQMYASSEGVITDRVHAAVAACSFGRPAHVIPLDNRFKLFDRGPVIKCGNIVELDHARLAAERQALATWLTKIYSPRVHT